MDIAPPPVGFRFAPAALIANIPALPCDVYIQNGGRAVLFAGAGAEAEAVSRRLNRGVSILIRHEDEDLLATALIKAIPGVLRSSRMGADSRSRIAYGLATASVRSLLSADAHPDASDLLQSHDVVDAITDALVGDDSLVGAMVAVLEPHPATYIQAINTAVYSVLLARRLGITHGEALRAVGRGALLHDIGKIKMPNEILDKPGPLDDREWAIVRKHPDAGQTLVVALLGSEPTYLHIIRDHHERSDGSGYPTGRSAHSLPYDSQLVAITDAFVGLTSVRSYQQPMSAAGALRKMRLVQKGQFNDEIMREFIALLAGWHDIRRHELGALLSALGH